MNVKYKVYIFKSPCAKNSIISQLDGAWFLRPPTQIPSLLGNVQWKVGHITWRGVWGASPRKFWKWRCSCMHAGAFFYSKKHDKFYTNHDAEQPICSWHDISIYLCILWTGTQQKKNQVEKNYRGTRWVGEGRLISQSHIFSLSGLFTFSGFWPKDCKRVKVTNTS